MDVERVLFVCCLHVEFFVGLNIWCLFVCVRVSVVCLLFIGALLAFLFVLFLHLCRRCLMFSNGMLTSPFFSRSIVLFVFVCACVDVVFCLVAC